MIKESKVWLFAIILLGVFLSINGVLAVSNVDLKITGTIGDYTSDRLVTRETGASTAFDAYDMIAPDFMASEQKKSLF